MFVCSACGYHSTTKLGRCPNCGARGSFEQKITDKKSSTKSTTGQTLSPKKSDKKSTIRPLSSPELSRVFHQGVRRGSVYLIGGEPGIGKSTLLLQILHDLTTNNSVSVSYFSGEENESQIHDRRSRIHPDTTQNPDPNPDKISEKNPKEISDENAPQKNYSENSSKNSFHIFHATRVEDILATLDEQPADCVIIDSIQTIQTPSSSGAAGSPSQVRDSAEQLANFAHRNDTTVIIVGHVTKGGEIAGPKYLEHIVDVVLELEGDRFGQLRFLRAKKNRFGHTDDCGIFEMTLFGLQPVHDIKDRILQNANTTTPGSVLSIGLDNGRPVLINLEVLLNKTKFKFPTRTALGVDAKRLDLIIAILEKYCKIDLGFFDIFVNIPGEFTLRDAGLDLAIATAIFSQYSGQTAPRDHIFVGEVSLSGQITRAKLHQKRAREIPDGFTLIDHELKTVAAIPTLFR